MPTSIGSLTWNGAQVLVLANKSGDAYLDAIAYDVMQRAKATAPLDTGFLRGSVYMASRLRSTYSSTPTTGRYLSSKTVKLVKREAIYGQPQPKAGNAFVVASAKYALYVEKKTKFLEMAWQHVIGNPGSFSIKTI
ncbi:MAG: hypothetical protein WCI88_01760 [Chloroflexota bacterium]